MPIAHCILSGIGNHDKKTTYDHDGSLENNVGAPATARKHYGTSLKAVLSLVEPRRRSGAAYEGNLIRFSSVCFETNFRPGYRAK